MLGPARGRSRTATRFRAPEGTRHLPSYDTLLTCPLASRSRSAASAIRTASSCASSSATISSPAQSSASRSATRRPTACSCAASDRRVHDRRARGVEGARAGGSASAAGAARSPTGAARSRAPPTPPPRTRGRAVRDHRQLVPGRGSVQPGGGHLSEHLRHGARRAATGALSFTQEWPVVSQTHQLSYTLPRSTTGVDRGFGDTLINYRYQALIEGPGRPAFSPRASLILPTGDATSSGHRDRRACRSTCRSASRRGDSYWHWNAGFTWLPRPNRRPANAAPRRSDVAVPGRQRASIGCGRCST